MKITKIKLFLFCLISFLWLSIYAQNNQNIRAGRNANSQAVIHFISSDLIIGNDAFFSISPDSSKVGVLQDENPEDSLASLKVYNASGNLTTSFSVKPLSRVAYFNDGRFALYGSEPTYHVAYKEKLILYSSSGQIILDYPSTFGPHSFGEFSNSGALFVFLGYSAVTNIGYKSHELIIFDQNFNTVGYKKIDTWPEITLSENVEINESSQRVYLKRKTLTTSNAVLLEKMVFDYSGNLIETLVGW